jgi:hypothetical protein
MIRSADHADHVDVTDDDDVVDCRCKLEGGRLARLTLPRKFSLADAAKIHAFLKTWVDDPETR